MKKIAVIGLGYVGLANAVLLAMDNEVVGMDVSAKRRSIICSGHAPFEDADIELALRDGHLNLKVCADLETSCRGTDYVLIAVPADTGADGRIDTSRIEATIAKAMQLTDAVFVLRSTVPIGFCSRMKEKYPGIRLLFVPEFSREGKSLHDSLHPSRVVIGRPNGMITTAEEFARMLTFRVRGDSEPLFMSTDEAEAVKLFSNAYLAMRVSFFNEMDCYAETCGLDARHIIEALGRDSRIGREYNNPSFGYGGNCLPKDVAELRGAMLGGVSTLMSAIISSNSDRMDYIAERALQLLPMGGTVGMFRLIMKKDSDNFRNSSSVCLVERLLKLGSRVVIYEPLIEVETYLGARVINNLDEFKQTSDIILANRSSKELENVNDRVYTRDLFSLN